MKFGKIEYFECSIKKKKKIQNKFVNKPIEYEYRIIFRYFNLLNF